MGIKRIAAISAVIAMMVSAPSAYAAAAGDPDSQNGQIAYAGQNQQIGIVTQEMNQIIAQCRAGRSTRSLLNRLRTKLNTVAFTTRIDETDAMFLADLYAGSYEMEGFC